MPDKTLRPLSPAGLQFSRQWPAQRRHCSAPPHHSPQPRRGSTAHLSPAPLLSRSAPNSGEFRVIPPTTTAFLPGGTVKRPRLAMRELEEPTASPSRTANGARASHADFRRRAARIPTFSHPFPGKKYSWSKKNPHPQACALSPAHLSTRLHSRAAHEIPAISHPFP